MATPQNQNEELIQKFGSMAKMDFEMNGAYMNAPYKIALDGEFYKGHIRVRREKETKNGVMSVKDYFFLSVERPAKQMVEFNVESPF